MYYQIHQKRLIKQEYWKKTGTNPDDNLLDYEEFRKDYLYDDVKRELRIKTFEVKYDKEAIQQIHERVELIREYIKVNKLLKEIENINNKINSLIK